MKKSIATIHLVLFAFLTTSIFTPVPAWSSSSVGKKAKITSSAGSSQSGREPADLATELIRQAIVLNKQGKYAEAEPLFRRALVIDENELGKDHLIVAADLNNLAGLLQDQGKYAEAKSIYRRSLEIREKELGPDHPDVARSLNNLAGLLLAQGKYSEAEPLCRRSIAIKE